MIDYESSFYKTMHPFIGNKREDNISWEDIKNLSFFPGEKFEDRFAILKLYCSVATKELFDELVDHDKNEEEVGRQAKVLLCPSSIIPDVVDEKNYELDESIGSSWMSYKRKLNEKKFDEETINSIETSSYKILNKLSLDTRESGPIKGLVVGNVQSGKTANMAALMSMAADQGWNMFIVLSGTIENLRIQTRNRLSEDLKGSTNVVWQTIENVSTDHDFFQSLSRLSLNESDNIRYLMVSLKNSKRLNNLLTWLAKDTKNREKLKILFIDDEADQASINAYRPKKGSKRDPETIERTKINNHLVSLFTNKDGSKKPVSTKFKSLNYVAYTATPYANILNERPSIESTYPANFISCLPLSKSYFGPQVIFGIDGEECEPMNIVNVISKDEAKSLEKRVTSFVIPKELENAVLWFYCCLAIQRIRKDKKPVSMLIHTSQNINEHDIMSESIKKWFEGFEKTNFINACKKVFDEQTSNFTKEDFYRTCPLYPNKSIQDYPSFEEIRVEIENIFDYGLKHILINSDSSFEYCKGINLCVDNCSYKINEDNEHIRLVYPEKDTLDYAAGFIVIGGATLSRGLTIEGLVSTYFLRSTKQADTLMQMGRWFGYRIGYEMLPRIWITESTLKQFEFLSVLDYDLRNELKNMQDSGISPSIVGPKIRVYPKRSFLSLTSKNKEKDMIFQNSDFTGFASQTTTFFENEEIQKKNLDSTIAFVSSLDKPIDMSKHPNGSNCYAWENVSYEKVLDYICEMSYPKTSNTYIEPKSFRKWYEKKVEDSDLNNWNVVIEGVDIRDDTATLNVGDYTISKVERSRKKDKYNDGLIRIGALRAPRDLYIDIDLSKANLTEDEKNIIKKNITTGYRSIRKKCGLSKTPLLVIYFINKDSKPKKKDVNRLPLDTKHDLVGLFFIMPDDDSYKTGDYVTVKLESNDLMEAIDVDGN